MNIDVMFGLAADGLIGGILLGLCLRCTWPARSLVGTVPMMIAAVCVLTGADVWEWRSDFPVGGEALHMRLDAISALFLALLSLIGATGAIYAREYWPDAQYPKSAARGRLWWSAM